MSRNDCLYMTRNIKMIGIVWKQVSTKGAEADRAVNGRYQVIVKNKSSIPCFVHPVNQKLCGRRKDGSIRIEHSGDDLRPMNDFILQRIERRNLDGGEGSGLTLDKQTVVIDCTI